MTTPTTPEQARDFAQSIFDDGAPDDEVELIRSLADQVESLTAERDALKDAAKLASRALNRIDAADIRLDTGERLSIAKAIAALKAVLK